MGNGFVSIVLSVIEEDAGGDGALKLRTCPRCSIAAEDRVAGAEAGGGRVTTLVAGVAVAVVAFSVLARPVGAAFS